MKCKLLRMSLLCLLFLFTFCISVSFASVDMTGFNTFNNTYNKYDFAEYLLEIATNYDFTEYSSNISSNHNSVRNNFNDFLSYLNGNSYNYIQYKLYKSSNAGSFGDNIYNAVEVTMSSSDTFSSWKRYTWYRGSGGNSYGTYSNGSSVSINSTLGTNENKFLYLNGSWYIASGNSFVPTFNLKFVPSSSDTINLTFNGVAEDFIRYNFNQYNGNINLGNLENISGYREIQCNLYIMQANGTTFVYDNLGGFTYYSLYGLQNAFLTGVDHGSYLSVQVNQSKIYKNQAYILKATGYKSDNSSSETTTNIYFLAYGDTSSSGDPINPDAEDPSIDWNLINTFNNGIDGPSGNTEFINNFYLFPSGDSGDTLFGFKYNYDDHGLGLGNFILQFVSDFYNFTTNYDNVSMDFGFLGVISSSDFISPNNAFFTLISFIVNAILCLVIIRFVFKLYQNIATFDIDKFINDNEDFVLF